MKLPKLVIFDLDGVIIDSEGVSKMALRQALQEFNCNLSEEVLNSFTGKSRKNCIAYLLEIMGPDFPAQDMFDRQTEIFFYYFKELPVKLKDGFAELYQFYKEHHVPMAIASSSRITTIMKHLTSLHIENDFNYILSGDKVVHSKPDPEIFLLVCEHFGVDVKDALVFEDSKNGVEAAHRAHIPVIAVLDQIYQPRDVFEKAIAMVPSLHQVIHLYQDPKLVLFDMDGLVVDTEYMCIEPFRQSHLEYGYNISDETLMKLIGTSGQVMEEILRNSFDEDYPYEAVIARADELMMIELNKHLPLKDGAIELLQYYNQKHIPCIVASSSPLSTIEFYLEKGGMRSYFQDIVCKDDVALSKPHPDIFIKGCEKMGVRPCDALVLEDSKNGILAANAANIPVICVPDLIYHDKEIFEKTVAFLPSLWHLTQF